jgi:hypothetical protein
VLRLDVDTGQATPITEGGLLNAVYDLAVEPSGSILVLGDVYERIGSVNYICPEVVRIDPTSGTQQLATTGCTLGLNPTGIAVGIAGEAYVTCWEELTRVDLQSGAQRKIVQDPPIGFGRWRYLSDVEVRDDGDLIVIDDDALYRVDMPSETASYLNSIPGSNGYGGDDFKIFRGAATTLPMTPRPEF